MSESPRYMVFMPGSGELPNGPLDEHGMAAGFF